MMMKVKAYLLTLLSILLLSACRSTAETPQLDLNDGGKGLELTARSTGDTLYIPFSSSVTDERLQITEAEDWIETELRRGQLLVYAARNSTPFARQAELILQIIERGGRQAARRITIRQEADESLATDRYLFPYIPVLGFPLSSYYSNKEKIYTIPLSATGGTHTDPILFRTNLSGDQLRISYDYGEGSSDWVHDLQIIKTEDSWGISLRADAIPTSMAQRRVRITLADAQFADQKISFDYLQLGHSTVSFAHPEQMFTSLGMLPQQISIPLKTDLPLSKLHLTVYVDSHNLEGQIERNGDGEVTPDYREKYRSPFWQYAVDTQDDQMERPALQRYFRLIKSPGGVTLTGQTTTSADFLDLSLAMSKGFSLVYCITNDTNDQKLWGFLQLPNHNRHLYLHSQHSKSEERITLPAEASEFALSYRTNLHFDDIEWIRPTFVTLPERSWGAELPVPEGSTIHYPDLTNLKGIRVTANPLRTTRRFSITATYGTYVGSEYIGPKLAPLQFTCEQAPFTGVYEFATSEDTTLDLAALPDDESSKMVVATIALTTNLSQEQIQITKPQARSGWIQAELGIDPETGYVSSIAFYLDKNTSGADRSTQIRLIPPTGEGLSPIIFSIRQTH